MDLPADAAETDHCGSCSSCLDICPTGAFPAPYQLDARRCISYLTIEYDGIIAAEFRKPMGIRIYGCDDCLAVCPWNKFASMAAETDLRARPALTAPTLVDQIGRASCRERVCQYVLFPVVAVLFKKQYIFLNLFLTFYIFT